MMILSLELENVKSYQQAYMEFTEGVNAIVGHNGAGKSTIVEAIGLALFNELNYTQGDFIRAGGKSAIITVTFESGSDERRYAVTRRIGTTPHIFIYDPELETRICEGRADVDRFLYEHLRLEPGTDLAALFRDAVGVAQGTLTAAFLQTEGNRRPIFDRLLQLDDYKTASDKLLVPGRLLRERRAGLDTQIAGTSARLERLDGLLAAIAQDKATLARIEAQRAELQHKLAEITDRRERMEAAQNDAHAAQQALTHVEQSVATLLQQEQVAQRALAEAEAAAQTVAQHAAGYSAYTAALEEQATLDRRADGRRAVAEQMAEAEKQVALHEAARQRLEEELTQIQEAEAGVTALAEGVARQEELENRIREAEREATRLDSAKQQAAQLAAELANLQTQRDKLQRDLAEAEALETRREQLESRLDSLRQRVDTRREELASFKTRADTVKDQSQVLAQEFALCPVCEQPLGHEQRIGLLARNQETLDVLRAEYAQVQAALKTEEGEVAEATKALAAVQAGLRRAPRAGELVRLEDAIGNTDRRLGAERATVGALEGAAEARSRLREALAALGDPKRQHAIAAAQAGQRAKVEGRLHVNAAQLAQARQRAGEMRTELSAFDGLDEQLARVRTALQDHLPAYQAVLGHRGLAEQVHARRDALAQTRAELVDAQARLVAARDAAQQAALQFNPDVYRGLREDEQNARTQLGIQENEATFVGERLARQEAEATQLRQLADEAAQMQAQLRAVQAQEKALEKIRTLLRQAQPYIARALVRRVSDTANQIFGDIMQDYSRHLQWTEDYAVTLRVGEHERQFAQLSGGEQMSAALSVRLALLREMSNINVAFFDEPTANLDETRRESLARQILQVRGFRQLFVISHDDTFEQATQNVIRVERINGASRVYSG